MEGRLFDVFAAFSGGITSDMNGRAFVKCMRDARLVDDDMLRPADVDLIFAKHKAKGARKINFDEFCHCLAEVAMRKEIEMDIVVRLVCDAGAPDYESGSACHSVLSAGAVSGPERFYYDKATYTGTHRHGGPTVIGGGLDAGDVVQDSHLVNRGIPLEDGLHRRKAEAEGRRPQLPTLLGADGAPRDRSPKAVERGAARRTRSPKSPERSKCDRTSKGLQKHDKHTTSTEKIVEAPRERSPAEQAERPPKEQEFDNALRQHLVQQLQQLQPQQPQQPRQMGQTQSMPAQPHVVQVQQQHHQHMGPTLTQVVVRPPMWPAAQHAVYAATGCQAARQQSRQQYAPAPRAPTTTVVVPTSWAAVPAS